MLSAKYCYTLIKFRYMKKLKEWFLHFVSKRTEYTYEPIKFLVNRCMICGDKFNKPVEIYSGETLMCKKCAESNKYVC